VGCVSRRGGSEEGKCLKCLNKVPSVPDEGAGKKRGSEISKKSSLKRVDPSRRTQRAPRETEREEMRERV
jgi:hypothetical protein